MILCSRMLFKVEYQCLPIPICEIEEIQKIDTETEYLIRGHSDTQAQIRELEIRKKVWHTFTALLNRYT